jgi:hypothetical protein
VSEAQNCGNCAYIRCRGDRDAMLLMMQPRKEFLDIQECRYEFIVNRKGTKHWPQVTREHVCDKWKGGTRSLTDLQRAAIDRAFWSSVAEVPARTKELAEQALRRSPPVTDEWIHRVGDACAKLND